MDGRPEGLQGQLDNINRPHDTRAEAARLEQQHRLVTHRRHTQARTHPTIARQPRTRLSMREFRNPVLAGYPPGRTAGARIQANGNAPDISLVNLRVPRSAEPSRLPAALAIAPSLGHASAAGFAGSFSCERRRRPTIQQHGKSGRLSTVRRSLHVLNYSRRQGAHRVHCAGRDRPCRPIANPPLCGSHPGSDRSQGPEAASRALRTALRMRARR